ncbi:MAG: homoprotocatechuate degradation operon regulator HpaR [Pseudomonadota bacterium]
MSAQLPSTARSLPFALLRAREGVMVSARAMLADTGVTEQQWRVLRVLAEFGAMDSQTLANRTCLLMPSLTRMTTTLRGKGLISQQRDSLDRRRHINAITQEGQQVIDDNADRVFELVSTFQAILGEDGYEQILDLLARLDAGAPR